MKWYSVVIVMAHYGASLQSRIYGLIDLQNWRKQHRNLKDSNTNSPKAFSLLLENNVVITFRRRYVRRVWVLQTILVGVVGAPFGSVVTLEARSGHQLTFLPAPTGLPLVGYMPFPEATAF